MKIVLEHIVQICRLFSIRVIKTIHTKKNQSGSGAMIDNTKQQTLDFIQYSLIFGELEENSKERDNEKYPLENATECSERERQFTAIMQT